MNEIDAEVTMTVNGRRVTRRIPPRKLLVDFLRDELDMKGTHIGCEVGACGCCNVLLDGRTARSCLTFAIQADGADVRTIEGVATEGKLHVVQEAFREAQGLQCGYCTPGMIMTTLEFLEKTRNPKPARAQVIDALSGNLCRCTGYETIVDAVLLAAQNMYGKGNAA